VKLSDDVCGVRLPRGLTSLARLFCVCLKVPNGGPERGKGLFCAGQGTMCSCVVTSRAGTSCASAAGLWGRFITFMIRRTRILRPLACPDVPEFPLIAERLRPTETDTPRPRALQAWLGQGFAVCSRQKTRTFLVPFRPASATTTVSHTTFRHTT